MSEVREVGWERGSINLPRGRPRYSVAAPSRHFIRPWMSRLSWTHLDTQNKRMTLQSSCQDGQLPYKENVAVRVPVATGNKNRTQNLEGLQKDKQS